jgi:hypothetical protein
MAFAAPELVLLLACFAGLLLVLEAGFRLGLRHRGKEIGKERTHLGTLQSALFGLLSLLLGFNFAMAASRFDTRNSLVQDEVNAIGTVSLRARLLPAEDRAAVLGLLKSYASSRVAAGAGNAQSSRIREQLSELGTRIYSRENPPAAADLFITSLTDMGNTAWKRHSALENHVPALTIALLLTVAAGSLGFHSYACGITGIRRHVSSGIFALMISLVLATIVDLDQPQSGLIQVREGSMYRLQAALEAQRE